MTAHLVDKTRKPIMDALKEAKLEAKDLDEVLLVGGSTRIPAVQTMIEHTLGKNQIDPLIQMKLLLLELQFKVVF